MKAERRHELQENTLAGVLNNFPLYLSIYGGRILLVVSAVVLAFVLLNYRSRAKLQQSENARTSLATVRDTIGQLGQLNGGFGASGQVAQQRAFLLTQATSSLEIATGNADSDTIKAETEIARGDLNWVLANLTDLPGAATQPALALPEKRDELLAKSESAYETVLAQYPSIKLSQVSALLGLGAIAENRGKFDLAQQRYEAITNGKFGGAHTLLASQRLAMLPMISKPRKFVPATMPTTMPATQPSTAFIDALNQPIEPSTQPTTVPSTAPVGQ